jgi:hypothetical protein
MAAARVVVGLTARLLIGTGWTMPATWHSSLLVAAIGSLVLCAACAAGSSDLLGELLVS